MTNIVLLSDGTGNSAGKVWRTNVWRLFQALDLKGSNRLHFTTTALEHLLLRSNLGGVFGVGLQRSVIVSTNSSVRNYQPGTRFTGSVSAVAPSPFAW